MNHKQQHPYLQFSEKNISLTDYLAIDRTLLANDRTFLSYMRTALTLFITGITFIKVFGGDPLFDILGMIFIPAGITIFLFGAFVFFKKLHTLAVFNQHLQQPVRTHDVSFPKWVAHAFALVTIYLVRRVTSRF